jgi:hypothetical protein
MPSAIVRRACATLWSRLTVAQKNVVRQIARLGLWRGKPMAYRLPAATDDGLKTGVVVQQPKGGRVLGIGQPRAPKA